MALKDLSAFGAGEITPELFERGNLDKFRTGLAGLRNATVTKTGGLKGRGGLVKWQTAPAGVSRTWFIAEPHCYFELTATNLRKFYNYNLVTKQFDSYSDKDITSFGYTDNNVAHAHFTNDDKKFYIFSEGAKALLIDIGNFPAGGSVAAFEENIYPNGWDTGGGGGINVDNVGWTAPTGYLVDYAVTFEYEGVEGFIFDHFDSRKIAANVGEANRITGQLVKFITKTSLPIMNVYRRPHNGGGWAFIGSNVATEDAGNYYFEVVDLGGVADVSNNPPEWVSGFQKDASYSSGVPNLYFYAIRAKTGFVYQGRVLFPGTKSPVTTFGTRVGSLAMSTDFPLQDDSALAFKAGSQGGAKVSRYYDSNGLLMFTNVGIYVTPTDLLVPATAYGVKRSSVVTDGSIRPLGLEDAVLVPDLLQEAIIAIFPSEVGSDAQYQTSELSIFSNHLFENRRAVAWDVSSSDAKYVWIVLDNGKLLCLSYHKEHQMQAWSRHDTDGFIEDVMTIVEPNGKQYPVFTVMRNGVRMRERLTEFRKSSEFLDYVGSDGSVIFKKDFGPMTITKLTDWDSNIRITAPSALFANTAGQGAAGSIFRIINSKYEALDVQVVTFTDTSHLIVEVLNGSDIREFFDISNAATTIAAPNFYQTWNELTGLNHLEGKKVSVRLDGFTHASPLNTDPNRSYPVYTVTGGKITLVEGERGAIISVGLPYVSDIVTLAVDTLQQAPTKTESMIATKMFLSYYESRPLYAAARLPETDTIEGMDIQSYEEEDDSGIAPTAPGLPFTERREVVIDSDWMTEGSVALRNVDPQPIHLIGIFPDIEVHRR